LFLDDAGAERAVREYVEFYTVYVPGPIADLKEYMEKKERS
jgi:hypothetical protein